MGIAGRGGAELQRSCAGRDRVLERGGHRRRQGARPAVPLDGRDSALPGAGFDITAAYNRFVVANRATLQGVNGVLMSVFRSGSGDDAQGEYDRYATALANAYGGDATNRSVCSNAERLADEAAAAGGSLARLVALHSRVGLAPPRPGGACAGSPALQPRGTELGRPAADRASVTDQRPLGWLNLDEPETERRR